MINSKTTFPSFLIPLDHSSTMPLYQQLYQGLREAILAGRLPAGTRLPSTRELAAELALARNTVLNAFEQLLAEGYLQGRVGSGTYVAHALPDEFLAPRAEPASGAAPLAATRRLSRRGALLANTPVSLSARGPRPPSHQPFKMGLPALDHFPFKAWEEIARRLWRTTIAGAPWQQLGYGAPAGYQPLREALASYLATARGVRCRPEQVLVVSGSQQALDLAARVLLDPGERACIEDPGYLGARGALIGAGAEVVPVPVDEEGLRVGALQALAEPVRLVYVSPSHQFPLGVTMSLARRLALLEWARQQGAWVLEDDYDSEYRYASRPLAAVQGLDEDGRVIYFGSLSKVLFPGLRLGYLVVPPDLVQAFVSARALIDRHSPAIEQLILTEFIAAGHFARHIRRMRRLYASRQELLLRAAGEQLAGLLEVRPAQAGMHLVGWLPPGVDDQAASRAAAAHGVLAPPLSAYRLLPAERGGLLLGYTALDEQLIQDGVRRLAAALRSLP